MNLPLPKCHSEHWPEELEKALEKFKIYDERKKMVLILRDRNLERPRISTWSLGHETTIYSSACFLWDILHVYNHMGCLYWNEAIRLFSEEKDHPRAKKMMTEAYRKFRSISESIIPSWNPSCRAVERHDKGDLLTKTFPQFLVSDSWGFYCGLSLAVICIINIDKSLNDTICTPKTVSKIAMEGYNILKNLPRTEIAHINTLKEKYSAILEKYALVFWARDTSLDEEDQIHGKRINVLRRIVSLDHNLAGMEDLREELSCMERINDHVHIQTVPQGDISQEILNLLQSGDMTKSLRKEAVEYVC